MKPSLDAVDLEPLEPELRDLLDGMRRLDDEDAAHDATSTRLLARVEGAIRASETSRLGGAHARLGSLALLIPLVLIGAGVAGMASRSDPRAPVLGSPSPPLPTIVSSAPAAATPAEAPSARVLNVDELPSIARGPSTPQPVRRGAVTAPRETAGLAEEMRLVDAAASAMRSKDHASVLRLVREHEQRFPAGELTQERERLFIQVLVETGHLDEARLRARAFRERFPSGLLLPSIERSLGDATTP
ncbi:MAG: hypothetical protein K0S65_5258 [Labilithrix sp.]|nr:hypothetical protein [Labilithrix sp.]